MTVKLGLKDKQTLTRPARLLYTRGMKWVSSVGSKWPVLFNVNLKQPDRYAPLSGPRTSCHVEGGTVFSFCGSGHHYYHVTLT